MTKLAFETEIDAPIGACLELALDVDLHLEVLGRGHQIADGVTSGVMKLGDHVTWEIRRLFVRIRMTSVITELGDEGFVDEMRSGPFKRWHHRHLFERYRARTIMKDQINYEVPFGLLGRLVDALFVRRFVTRLVERQNALLKTAAEARERTGD